AVDPHLHEAAGVAEQVDPLARRQLAAVVLKRDLLLAAAELRPLAPGVDVLGEALHPGPLTALDRVWGLARPGRRLGIASGRGGFGSVWLGNPGRLVPQRPFPSGSRFCKKALSPSWMSSVEKVSESCERRNSSASSRAMSCWRYIASWPSRISTGLFEASFVAHSSTAAPNSAAGTTLLASPYSTASSA